MRLVLRRNLKRAPKPDKCAVMENGLLYRFRDVAAGGVFMLLSLNEDFKARSGLEDMDPLVVAGKHNWYMNTFQHLRARRIMLKGQLSRHSDLMDSRRYVVVKDGSQVKPTATKPLGLVLLIDCPLPPISRDAWEEINDPT